MRSVLHLLLYEVDWSAISTLILTVITGYYAWSTRQILAATARQAKAAEENLQIVLLEHRQRIEQHSAPIDRTVVSGLAITAQWLQALREKNMITANLPRLEPEEFFDAVNHARAVSFSLYDKFLLAQDHIVSARVALDMVTSHDHSQQYVEALINAILQLQTVWIDAREELMRISRK